jgi:hypothetical protein
MLIVCGHGVSAPRCICILCLKCILNIFENDKINIKMPYVHLNMLYAHKIISAKTDMFGAVCKENKFW